MQFVTHRVINRPGLDRRHVSVDAEGYKSRRDDSLASMAKRLGKQRLVGKRGDDRLLVADTVLETADDGAGLEHRLQLLEGVDGVVALHGEKDVIKRPAGLGDTGARRQHGLAADLAGDHHPDSVAGDRLDVRLAADERDLAPCLRKSGAQEGSHGSSAEEEIAGGWR